MWTSSSLFGLNFLLIITVPGFFFLQRPLVLPQVPFCINEVRVAEVGLGLADVPRVCWIVSHLCTGGRSVKNLISLYSGECFSFLNISIFRIKLNWGLHRCCALWGGENRRARAVCVAGAPLPAQGRDGWRWTPAPHDELHNIAFLKTIITWAEPAG